MLGITGWRIGACYGPAELMRPIQMVHQFIPFSVSTPLQVAAAKSMQHAIDTGYFDKVKDVYQGLRDKLVGILNGVEMQCIVPDGGYFVLANTTSIRVPVAMDCIRTRDDAVCRFLTVEAGVTAIPPSAFYNEQDVNGRKVAGDLARFAFCKSDAMLDEAGDRLRKWHSKKHESRSFD